MKHKDPAQLKDSLTKFRQAKWAISETCKFVNMLTAHMKVPLEFDSNNLSFLKAIFEGLTYLSMLRILQQNPNSKPEDLASLLKEISRWFLIAKQMVEKDKMVAKYHERLVADVYYNHYMNATEANVMIINHLLNLHENEVTKGHLGVALGFMIQTQSLMKCMSSDKKLEKHDRAKIEAVYEQNIANKIKDVKEKNDKVYKFKIPQGQELTAIKTWDKVIEDLCPANMYNPPDNTECFNDFLSDELERVRTNLDLYINNKKQFVQKYYYDISSKKDMVYREHKIGFIVGCNNLQAQKLDQNFYLNLKVIAESNGGFQGYEAIRSKIGNEKNDMNSLMAQIDSKINMTKQEDAEYMKKNVPGYVTFENANAELIDNIISIHTQSQTYLGMEGESEAQYQGMKNWLQKFGDKSINWEEYCSAPQMASYINEHAKDINVVVQTEEVIQKITGFLQKEYSELTETLNGINIWEYIVKVSMREMVEEDVYKQMDERTLGKFNKFEETVIFFILIKKIVHQNYAMFGQTW